MRASDIIGKWPSAEHFASDIGLKYPSYGRVMKMRERIPEKYWEAAAAAARARGLPVSIEQIRAAHSLPLPTPEPAQ